jgi:peptide/nickel transport system permease protein
MAAIGIDSLVPIVPQRDKPRRGISRFLRRNPLSTLGLAMLLVWVLLSAAAPLVTRYDPKKQFIPKRLSPPGAAYLFGSDQLGRDVESRVIYAGRVSIPAGVLVVVAAGCLGTVIGAVSGFMGGWVDEVIMRLTEVFLAFPTIILSMTIAAALGPNLLNAVIAMVVVWWPQYARLVRAQVLSVKHREFVEAAYALGSSGPRVLVRSILPNCIAPVIVLATTDLGTAILVFSGLSFLGLGPDPSIPEWGRMAADGLQFFDQWWMAAFPGLAICSLALAFNFVGDGIRDALDPRTR